MLNPESVILNLVQNLFRAGLIQPLTKPTHSTPRSEARGMASA
jgi:hypothetical protein